MYYCSVLACLVWLAWLQSGAVADDAASLAEVDACVERGVGFLLRNQADDGAWRSTRYGVLKEGPELTPWICLALAESRGLDNRRRAAILRAVRYSSKLLDTNGSVQVGEWGLNYPVYTAAAASRSAALADGAQASEIRQHWLNHLWSYQLREPLGWRPKDASYGGWAFGAVRLKRPNPLPAEFPGANLSVTLLTLEALRAGGVKADDPRIGPIRNFVLRCQNLPAEGRPADPKFDDGGFFFSPDDWIRNKAGDGVDGFGQKRFYSYGSCTADGLRALLLCGLPPTDRRVVAAHRWLLKHFDATEHPGRFSEQRLSQKDAYYFYYAQSAAQALAAFRKASESSSTEAPAWARSLVKELVGRQKSDGSWQSQYTEGKEDDPLLATHLALTALATCRRQLADEGN